ncbi:unnamed protein product, partial [marine sediment metagenome]
LTFLGFLLSLNIALWGLYGNELILFSLVNSSLLVILFSLPYIADRLIYPKFKEKGILSTITFPIITTAIFFLFSLEGPFDGIAYFAVFEYGILSFKQIASIAVRHWVWRLVYIINGVASLMLAYLLYQSKLIPRSISVLGLIGGAVLLAGTSLAMFGLIDVDQGAGMLVVLPGGLFELILPIWLIVKGFNSSAIDSPSAKQI